MFKKGLPILLASMLVASPTFAAKHDQAKHAQKSYLVVKKEEAKKKQELAKKKKEQKMLKNKLAELNKKLRKIELRLNEISTALETLSMPKEQQVEPATQSEQTTPTTGEATQPINEQDGTVVTTPEQPAVTQADEQDEAEKQEELDKWIGKLISTSNQLKAVKNEIRALEKKGFTNVGDVQTLKEKVKMLDEKVQQNKKKLLELHD